MKSNLIFLICQATKVNKKRLKVEPECEVRILFVGLGWLELDLRGSRGSEVIVQIPRFGDHFAGFTAALHPFVF